MIQPETFKRRLLRALAEHAKRRFESVGESEILSSTWEIRRVGTDALVVRNPFYWARFYYLGRGAVRPREARFLVWFRDPSDDPRLRPSPPRRIDQVRRLTAEQFRDALAAKQIIVARRSGPWRGIAQFRAVQNALGPELRRMVEREFREFLRQIPPRQGTRGNVATFRLT